MVQAPMEKIWQCWTEAPHIMQWNRPSADWHTVKVEQELRPGGPFLMVVAAKDGSDGFDFAGIYEEVVFQEKISYTTSDGRKTINLFADTGKGISIIEIFEPAESLSYKMQQEFCRGVLNSFKDYVESGAEG